MRYEDKMMTTPSGLHIIFFDDECKRAIAKEDGESHEIDGPWSQKNKLARIMRGESPDPPGYQRPKKPGRPL